MEGGGSGGIGKWRVEGVEGGVKGGEWRGGVKGGGVEG